MRPRPNDRVAILAYDGLRTFEFGIAVELFALARPELDRWYSTVVAAVTPGPLRATGGVTVEAAVGLDAVAGAGTVVIPGWPDLDGPVDPEVAAALSSCVARGGRVLGICSGAFALAQTGLLDGRTATTHWSYAASLAQRHPRVHVDADALYVDQESVLTSAGSAAGIDAGLHLIREDWGADVAATVARRMVMAPHRDGGQAQYVAPARPHDTTGWLADLLLWALERLHDPLGVDDLAGRVAVSPRTLNRRFAEQVGTSPGRWLTRQRVLRAQELLTTTDVSVDRVAAEVGLGSAGSLRHHFRQQLGTSPTAYRRRFHAAGAEPKANSMR